MSRLRLAVIGAGHLGRIHTRLASEREDVELVAVVDPIAAARGELARQFQIRGVADVKSIQDSIDAAIIATPTQYHYAVARDLLELGKHCLVEKPITTTVAEADALIIAARRRGAVLQVGHVERFNPAVAAVKAELGRIRYIEAVRASTYSCRSTDVGVILDLMIHDLDLLLSLTGAEVSQVSATALTVVGPHEDVAQARLELTDGCVANLSVSRVSSQPQRTWQIYGERAFATLDLASGTARLLRPTEMLRGGTLHVNQLSPAEKLDLKENFFRDALALDTQSVAPRNAIQDEQSDFVNAIRSGGLPQVTGVDGRRALVAAQLILNQLSNVRIFEQDQRQQQSDQREEQAVKTRHAQVA